MEKLNAENIINEIQSLIKALKDCGGWVKRGNGEGWFNHEILADALALINSQEQRIKELAEENERLRAENEKAQIFSVFPKDEELKYLNALERMAKEYKTVRADTVRKMLSLLHEKKQWARNDNCDMEVVDIDDIDQIAKEMLEGEK